jgi:hypothetical protein
MTDDKHDKNDKADKADKHDYKTPKLLGEDPDASVPGRPETFPKDAFAADPNKLPYPEEGGGELEVPLRMDSTAPPMYRAYNDSPLGETIDPRDGMGGETGSPGTGPAPKRDRSK